MSVAKLSLCSVIFEFLALFAAIIHKPQSLPSNTVASGLSQPLRQLHGLGVIEGFSDFYSETFPAIGLAYEPYILGRISARGDELFRVNDDGKRIGHRVFSFCDPPPLKWSEK